MPLALTGLVLGALFGGYTAWRRKGNRLDIAQYAAVYAIMFALFGLIIAIVIYRTGS